MEHTTTFRHEAGPGLPSIPDIWENEDSPHTGELLTQIADGIRETKILKDEKKQMEEENSKLRAQNDRLMKAEACLRDAFDILQREAEEMRAGLSHSLGDKNKHSRQEPFNTDQDSNWFGVFRGTRSNQVSRDPEVSALRAEITKYKKRS